MRVTIGGDDNLLYVYLMEREVHVGTIDYFEVFVLYDDKHNWAGVEICQGEHSCGEVMPLIDEIDPIPDGVKITRTDDQIEILFDKDVTPTKKKNELGLIDVVDGNVYGIEVLPLGPVGGKKLVRRFVTDYRCFRLQGE